MQPDDQMRLRTLIMLIVPAIGLIIGVEAAHAQDTDERPSNAERARPWESREYREGEESEKRAYYPYIQRAVPTISEEFGWFLNPNTIEPEDGAQQNESSIAVSTVNPNVLIASAVDFRGAYVYISTDGGRTWRDTRFGPVNTNWTTGNDPSVAFDYEGNGYVMYGAFPQGNSTGESGVYIAKTADNGATWQTHIKVIEHKGKMTKDSAFEDKYYVEIDNAAGSPYRGRMYTPWKRVIDRDSSTQIVVARSVDRGLTWSDPVPVSPRKHGNSLDTTFGQSFPLTSTGPDGTLYVVWNDGPIRSIGFSKSTDGGATFSAPSYPVAGYPTLGTARKYSGSVYHVLKNTFRAETYPAMMVDNSDSPRRGWIYLAYAAGLNPNVYFLRSTDNGATWSAPKVVHSDTTNDQWWPWLSVDETNGDIAITYSDSRNDPANILIEGYVSYSPDGGDTWIDRRTTDFKSDYRPNNIFAGDYSGNTFHNGKIFPSYLDMRDGVGAQFDSDVFTALVNIRQPFPVENLVVRGQPDNLGNARVTWTYPAQPTTVFGFPVASYNFEVRRNGALAATLPAGTTAFDDAGLLIDSTYRYQVRVVVGTDTSIDRTVRYRPSDATLPLRPFIFEAQGYKPTLGLRTRIPSVRADSSTPLGNLAGYRLYRDGQLVREASLAPGDTGTTITIEDTPAERGYYRYTVTVIDASNPVRESAAADTTTVYVGETTPYTEGFDGTRAPRFLYSGTWGPTTKQALSAPNCATDSPEGDYLPRRSTSMQIFPVRTDATELIFSHIVIVDPGDSAVVEASYDQGRTWGVLKRYSFQDDPAWADKVANPGDWRQGRLTLTHPDPGTGGFCLVRFRLTTGAINNADGWYVDDISFGAPAGLESGAERTTRLTTRVLPNPASSAAIIGYNLPAPAHVLVRVYDIVGRTVATPAEGASEAGDHTVTLDCSGLPPGTYPYEVRAGAERVVGTIVVLH